jgi:hypothetical protein
MFLIKNDDEWFKALKFCIGATEKVGRKHGHEEIDGVLLIRDTGNNQKEIIGTDYKRLHRAIILDNQLPLANDLQEVGSVKAGTYTVLMRTKKEMVLVPFVAEIPYPQDSVSRLLGTEETLLSANRNVVDVFEEPLNISNEDEALYFLCKNDVLVRQKYLGSLLNSSISWDVKRITKEGNTRFYSFENGNNGNGTIILPYYQAIITPFSIGKEA